MKSFNTNFGGALGYSNLTVDAPVDYSIFKIDSDIKVKVYPLFYKQMVIEWSIPASWGAASFNVFRSSTDYGPWTLLNETPLSGDFFKDLDTEQYSKFNNDFYMVDCILSTGRVIRSKISTWHNTRNTFAEIRAREIQRREVLLLTKFTGVKSLVFRKRTFGKRCSNCWDPRIEKIVKDKCEVCLGTSFEGGYFPPFETLLQYDPTPNQPVYSYQGKIEPNVIPAWTVSFPEVNGFDIIVRVPDSRIYRVEAIQTTELQTVTVRQIFNLNELDKETIEFKLVTDMLPAEYRN